MDFLEMMGSASKLLKAGKITQDEWNTINAIAESHSWD